MAGTSVLAAGGSDNDFAVAKVDEVGAPSAGFGIDGGVATAKPGTGDDVARAVAVLGDGRIVLAGAKAEGSGIRSPLFAVARLSANGAVDTTFGSGGVASFDFDTGGTWKKIEEQLRGLAVDSRGRAVVAGYVSEQPQAGPPFYRTVIARLREDGSLDPLFANGGKLSFTNLPDSKLRGSALARAANGALLVAGSVEGAGEIFVTRIIP
jgi:uncharacterized delta-60 repeat protein